MNVVFLDVDGVLNGIESMLVHGSYNRLCAVRCGLVALLCREGKAKIVISSSWRNGDTRGLQELFNSSRVGAACISPLIIGETPRISGVVRGEEIRRWIESNTAPDRYVIIDDDDDMLPGQPFVRTSIARGFGLDEYLDALAFLDPNHKHLKDLHGYRGSPRKGWRVADRDAEREG
jgi:hypothetical protein